MLHAVTVKYYVENTVDVLVHAEDEEAAGEKALERISGWGNVSDDVELEIIDICEGE